MTCMVRLALAVGLNGANMASVNKVILIGNLGADPEIRYAGNGESICNLRLATNQVWTDKNTGKRMEATEWHKVVLYRKLAEVAGRYLKKGSRIYVEGKIRSRKWQDNEGVRRTSTEIEAIAMNMLDDKASATVEASTGTAVAVHQSAVRKTDRTPDPTPVFLDDTIPF